MQEWNLIIAYCYAISVKLPKSGGDRPACLTVADCGQIAGFGEVSGKELVGW